MYSLSCIKAITTTVAMPVCQYSIYNFPVSVLAQLTENYEQITKDDATFD